LSSKAFRTVMGRCAPFLDSTRWYEYFSDPTLADAVLDPVIHQSDRIALNGEESLRKKHPAKKTGHDPAKPWTPVRFRPPPPACVSQAANAMKSPGAVRRPESLRKRPGTGSEVETLLGQRVAFHVLCARAHHVACAKLLDDMRRPSRGPAYRPKQAGRAFREPDCAAHRD